MLVVLGYQSCMLRCGLAHSFWLLGGVWAPSLKYLLYVFVVTVLYKTDNLWKEGDSQCWDPPHGSDWLFILSWHIDSFNKYVRDMFFINVTATLRQPTAILFWEVSNIAFQLKFYFFLSECDWEFSLCKPDILMSWLVVFYFSQHLAARHGEKVQVQDNSEEKDSQSWI